MPGFPTLGTCDCVLSGHFFSSWARELVMTNFTTDTTPLLTIFGRLCHQRSPQRKYSVAQVLRALGAYLAPARSMRSWTLNA